MQHTHEDATTLLNQTKQIAANQKVLTLLDRLKRDFTKVRHVNPEASRADSAEMYVVGTGFRG